MKEAAAESRGWNYHSPSITQNRLQVRDPAKSKRPQLLQLSGDLGFIPFGHRNFIPTVVHN